MNTETDINVSGLPTSASNATPGATFEKTLDAARSDEDIEASIQTKIEAAVAAAAVNGTIDPDQPVGVVIGPDGSIEVRNVVSAGEATAEPGIPDHVEFPAMYADDSRESLTDSHYTEHLESHWGF